MKIKKLAIANRGEVAVRIIHACRELGIHSILLHSEADIQSRAYRMSDEQICIGPTPSSESYLNIQANVDGAVAMGADALHPGFGFLSENAEFAERCEEAGIIFVGPSPESIRLMGDKISAKEIVDKAGVPTIPGYQGEDQSIEVLTQECERIGYPVIVKAAAGGGGRGMKVIREAGHAKEQIQSAQREGLAAFGSEKVFLEKYMNRAKHIEIQVFGAASGKVTALFDRECSIQRRHQKIIEEAVSPALSVELREEMNEAACKVARQVSYRGAGTVEFLLQEGKYYFLEMNTRLQVEHPVTEEVMGIDLVKAQILTAAEEPLAWGQHELIPRGHSIECRVYAEDAYNKGLPSTGPLGTCVWPQGPGRRFEYGFEKGDEITSFYDPMIAKVIVWDENRERARRKMLQVLDEAIIFGVKTNIPFLKEILSHDEFISGVMTTRFIDSYFPEGLPPRKMSEVEMELGQKLWQESKEALQGVAKEQASPWQGFWRGV